MVKIRLARIGRHFDPSYRIVIADSRNARDGRCVEQIGHYDPNIPITEAVIDEEKAVAWLLKGAVPTDSVRTILSKKGILAKFIAAKSAK